jgi:hypothetical protein
MSYATLIESKKKEIAMTKDVQNFYIQRNTSIISDLKVEIKELKKQLKSLMYNNGDWSSILEKKGLLNIRNRAIAVNRETLSFYIGRYNSIISDLELEIEELTQKLSAEKLSAEKLNAPYPIKTKLKWVSNVDEDTYCVAIVTKKGILEVKNVSKGSPMRYNPSECTCDPRALVKTLFATEHDWLKSVKMVGKMTVTPPNGLRVGEVVAVLANI